MNINTTVMSSYNTIGDPLDTNDYIWQTMNRPSVLSPIPSNDILEAKINHQEERIKSLEERLKRQELLNALSILWVKKDITEEEYSRVLKIMDAKSDEDRSLAVQIVAEKMRKYDPTGEYFKFEI